MKIYIRTKIESLEQFIPLAKKYNTGLELALSFEDLGKKLEKDIFYGLSLTVHAPFFDVNIASFNRFVSEKSIELMKNTLEFCNRLKVDNVVFHHNYQPFLYNFDEDGYTERFCRNFEQILESRRSDYFISLENVFETDSSIGKKIISSLNRDFVGFCFDCGHFNLFTEITLEEWLADWGDKIFEFHLHNNYGYRDDHNSLTSGNIDIKKILSLRKAMFYTIENRNVKDTEDSIIFLKELCR